MRITFTDPNGLKLSSSKRVRRIQVELVFYRQQVEELELQLKRLKLQKTAANITSINQQHKANLGSVWDDVAKRQLKARVHVEQQNKKLKALYKESRKFSMELEKLLRKSELSKQELTERVKFKPKHRFWNLTAEEDDEVFSEQLAIVTRMFLDLQQQYQFPSRTIHFGWDLSLGKEVVKMDPSVKTGMVFESQTGAVLPFTLEVAVEAFWKFFGYAHEGDARCITGSGSSMKSLSRSFSLHMNFEGLLSRWASIRTESSSLKRSYTRVDRVC